MKLTKGTVVRMKSFAHVEPDGKMKGFSASPEDTPEEKREVFNFLALGKEPLMQTPEQRGLYALNITTELNTLGWYKADQLEDFMRNNIGTPGAVFQKLLREHLDALQQPKP